MNKKRLSVVMAGAMLASSVAPVLAAETTTQKDYEVNGSNKGLLIRDLRNLLTSKVFKNVKENIGNANDTSDHKDAAGLSVYYVTLETKTKKVEEVGGQYATIAEEINKDLKALGETATFHGSATNNKNDGKNYTVPVGNASVTFNVTGSADRPGTYSIVLNKKFDNRNITDLETLLQNARTGTIVKVFDRGHIEKDGDFYGKYLEDTIVAAKLTNDALKTEYDYFKTRNDVNGTGNANVHFPAVYDMKLEGGVLTVYTRQVDTEEESGRKKFEFKAGDDYVDFTKAINAKGEELEPNTTEDGKEWITKDIAGFALNKKTQYGYKEVKKGDDIVGGEVYTVTITDVDNIHNVVLSELYTGLFLTEKGEELLNTLKEYDKEGYKVTEGAVVTKANGLYSLTIELSRPINSKETVKNQIVITTNDKGKIDFFKKGITAKTKTIHGETVKTRKFPVQKLVGATRHETAVKVARENADIKTVAENGNIVLVNSDSLVDGLAAAPLAASVINQNNTVGGTESGGNWDGADGQYNYVAPILLTNRDGLDKVTKDYIKEVVAHQRVGNLDKVTVYLVGGEAVISKAVENDLEEAGLRVVRAGGKDREATSLKVAEIMAKDTKAKFDSAFLVGATGEADAMSIASYAAENKTPIIVESVHGISEATVDYLKGYKVDEGKNVTIIGGKKAVSEATEETLKAELKGKKVERLFGADRKATNAKVIAKLYKNGTLDHILVSKDGIARKGELIDALTATSIAAKYHTPIVLGTNNLSKEQIEAIEDAASRSQQKYLYQIGGNVEESVMKTIADRLSLSR